MDYVLAFIGALMALVGIMGCIVPGLPGPPLNFLALVVLHFTRFTSYTTKEFLIYGGIAAAVSILDYLMPLFGAKKYGSSKAGTYGGLIGIVVGAFFFPPVGIIAGPFFGAVIGELINQKKSDEAIRAGWGIFVGFLAGAALKFIVAGYLTWIFFKDLFVN